MRYLLLLLLLLLTQAQAQAQDFSVLSDLVTYKVEVDFGLTDREPRAEPRAEPPQTTVHEPRAEPPQTTVHEPRAEAPRAEAPRAMVNYPAKSAPTYNLEGSWTDIHNVHKLRRHLQQVHNYEINWLNKLNLNQLWHLHDATHMSRGPRPMSRGSRPLSHGSRPMFCPT